jgi:hypothetical protein
MPGASSFRVRGINDKGVAVGNFYVGGKGYGFVRAVDGTITPFTSDTSYGVTSHIAINAAGTVVGFYSAGTLPYERGFVRAPDGTTTLLTDKQMTNLLSINKKGDAAGLMSDLSYKGPFYGFIRAADGTITKFMPLGAYSLYSTFINGNGQIAGTYMSLDSKYPHGYIRLP